MADFTEVMMQAHRMCAMQKRCEECPGWDVKESFCRISCVALSDFYVLEQNVLTWAAEHPERVYPSWDEAWSALYPDAYDKQVPCPRYFLPHDKYVELCEKINGRCYKCRQQPISAEIAEKLGIMPKEAGE